MVKSNLLILLLVTAFPSAPSAEADTPPPPMDSWQQVVRNSPYWVSQGVYKNLTTIRRWVLAGEAYCEDKQRHILFDRRATFLGYIPNAADAQTTQATLNQRRKTLAAEGRTDGWAPGGTEYSGYPFALSCNQPDAQLAIAMARYRGTDTSARLWGTWDGMSIGQRQKKCRCMKPYNSYMKTDAAKAASACRPRY